MKLKVNEDVFVVKKRTDYINIPCNMEYECERGCSTFLDRYSFEVTGYCKSKRGYMVIYKCVKCNEEYRNLLGDTRHNLKEFKESLGILLFMKKYKKYRY